MKLKKMKMAVLLAVTKKPKFNYIDNEDFSPRIMKDFQLGGYYTDRYYKMLMGRKPKKLNPFKRNKYERWTSPAFDADKIRRSKFKEIQTQIREKLDQEAEELAELRLMEQQERFDEYLEEEQQRERDLLLEELDILLEYEERASFCQDLTL